MERAREHLQAALRLADLLSGCGGARLPLGSLRANSLELRLPLRQLRRQLRRLLGALRLRTPGFRVFLPYPKP